MHHLKRRCDEELKLQEKEKVKAKQGNPSQSRMVKNKGIPKKCGAGRGQPDHASRENELGGK